MNKNYIIAKAVEDIPCIKAKKGDLLVFNTEYTLKDKGVYFFKNKKNACFAGMYIQESKRFFVGVGIVPQKLGSVEILGEFKGKYIEVDFKGEVSNGKNN